MERKRVVLGIIFLMVGIIGLASRGPNFTSISLVICGVVQMAAMMIERHLAAREEMKK